MQQQEGQNNLYVWTVMEEGIEGKCENTYQVTEIPEYMVHDYEKGMFQPELCQGKKFWQVLRTRDITKCTDRSVFLSSKGHKNCVVGNCETENSKQTQTRYFACGLTAEDMQLHGIDDVLKSCKIMLKAPTIDDELKSCKIIFKAATSYY